MDTKTEMAIHYLCPYSQRVLFTSKFKDLNIELVEVDLANPSPWFLDLNPSVEAPALKITEGEKVTRMVQSVDISIYLNSFPGPNLYPTSSEDGEIIPQAKEEIDFFVRTKISRAGSYFYSVIFCEPEAKDLEDFKAFVGYLEGVMTNGQFVMKEKLGYEGVTLADVMVYPFIERYIAYEEHCKGALDNTPGMHQWFEAMNRFSWIQAYKVPDNRHRKVYEIRTSPGEYQPLRLPISFYD